MKKNTRLHLKNILNCAVKLFRIQCSFGPWAVLIQFAYVLFDCLKSLVPVILPKLVIDYCTAGRLDRFTVVVAFFSLFCWAADSIVGISEWIQSIYNLKFAHYFKQKICEKTMQIDYGETENPEYLDSIERALDAAYNGLSQTLFTDLFVVLFKLTVLFLTLTTLNWGIAVLALSVVIVIYLINRKASEINHRFEMEKSQFKRKASYAFGQFTDFCMAMDMRVFDFSKLLNRKYTDSVEGEIKITVKQNHYKFGFATLKTFLNCIIIALLYIFSIYKFASGILLLSSFTMYIAAFSELYGSIDGLFRVLIDFRESAMKYEEVNRIFCWKQTIIDGNKRQEFSGHLQSIEFQNVTFTYPGTKKPSVDNLSFLLKAGDRMMLVGENGAGKTTIVKLLLRLYDVDSGKILLNGIDIRTYDYMQYVRLFAPVFQEIWLFAYSVRENVLLGGKKDEQQYKESLDFSDISDVIAILPEKDEAFCGKTFDENGINFSGGEQQKLCISRAYYKNAPLFVMDEPNSALDALSEKRLIEKLTGLPKDKMLLLISHRLSMSRFCNKILVLEKGRLIESGTHDALLRKNGIYARMFAAQAERYKA